MPVHASPKVHELEIPFAFNELMIPSRYKAYEGGRGSAKSHSMAQALTLKGRQRPIRWLCCREIQKSIGASVKQLLDDKITAAGLMGTFYHSTQYEIRGENGTQFLFAGLRTNPDSIKSMEGLDGAWIEEAHTASQRSIDILIPTLRAEGSELWASWNRRSKKDPIDNMFLGGPAPPRSIVRKVNFDDNPYFPQVLRDELEWDKSRDMDKYRHIWLGEPVIRSDARVFNNWVVDDIDDTGILETTPRLGGDWGFSIDPTVLIECYVLGRTLYFRREAWKVKCAIDETPSLFAGADWRGDRWTNVHGHRGMESVRQGHRIVADSARPETIAYMKDKGFDIVSARKGPGSIMDGIEFINSFDVVIHPDCTHIQDEFETYSYKEDDLTGEVLPILVDSKNHTIDAARYALENVRKVLQGRIGLIPPRTITSEL